MMNNTLANLLAMLVIATTVFAIQDQTHDAPLSRSRLRNIARHREHALAERQINNGYAYAGCVTDGSARVLTGANTWAADMTVDDCVVRCSAGEYKYAGLQSESAA
jgi:hypothetical protein